MSSRNLFFSASIISQVLTAAVFANVSAQSVGFTAGSLDNNIYAIDLQSGLYSAIKSGLPNPSDLAVANANTAYILGSGDGNIYALNLNNNSLSLVTPTPLPAADNLTAIALANNNTAYVTGNVSNTIYSVNLQSGAFSSIANIAGNPGLDDIAIKNTTTAYTIGVNNNTIYLVNLQTGASSVVATIPGSPEIDGIALANSTTAYVTGAGDSTVRVVDLQTGASSIVTTILGGPTLAGISIDGTTAYTVSNNDFVYAVNLVDGSVTRLAVFPFAVGIKGIALFMQVPTQGLSGNNRKFAKYLNKNAPIDVVREFALLNKGLASALESAAPTRNAFMTYASQNAYVAASQVVSDHTRGRRIHQQMASREFIASEFSSDELLVDASDTAGQISFCRKPVIYPKARCEKKNDPYTFWVTPFGEYAQGKSQNQTPGFNIGLGGVLAAFELNREDEDLIGFGAAYVYDHVHEDNGAGHANVNQGFLTVYGTSNENNWYFDLGLWGGYYHGNNQRNISFPGVKATAKSNVHGWQIAPHIEVGYDGFNFPDNERNWFGIEPFLMGDWIANWEHGFKEHGAGSLNIGQKERFCSLLRGETGLRFNEIAQYDWGQLVFREKISYAAQRAFHTGTITGFLVGFPGSFTVKTLTETQNLGVGELSMVFIFNNPNAPYIDIRYEGEFGSRFQSHLVMLEIGKDF